MEDLLLEVKNEVIEALNLEDMTPEDLGDDDPLFGADGLGLDSIDALELIVLLEKKYGIKLQDPKRRNTASNCRIPKTARRCLSLSE